MPSASIFLTSELISKISWEGCTFKLILQQKRVILILCCLFLINQIIQKVVISSWQLRDATRNPICNHTNLNQQSLEVSCTYLLVLLETRSYSLVILSATARLQFVWQYFLNFSLWIHTTYTGNNSVMERWRKSRRWMQVLLPSLRSHRQNNNSLNMISPK